MFVELGRGFRFPIPLRHIYLAELKIMEKIHGCRKEDRKLFGEAKLSDRQTVILLSYFITSMIMS